MNDDFEVRVFVGNLIGKQLLVRTLMSSVVLSLLLTISQAQTVRPPLSATPVFPAAYSLRATDAFSFTANQAVLANATSFTAGFYGERRFLLPELSFYRAAVCVPTTSGSFGFTGAYFGSSRSFEAAAGLAYGRRLADKVDIGAQFNCAAVKVAGYGSASALYVEVGALWHLTEQVHLGMHVSNPTAASLGKEEKDLLPSVFAAGIGYEVSPQFFVGGEVQKTVHRDFAVNTGMQYRFDDRLWARAGFHSESYYLGVGVGLKALRLDAVVNVHPLLGVTPGLQLIFNRKEEKS